MKTIKLSDFYPYDRNKGGIQELHHKIESKTLQYWGEDSGILIGITPIYKIRLWSEEVKVVNDKMTNMKTRTYEGVQHGDWVRCVLCGAQMLLPCGADKCPECSSKDTLMWVDENRQEMDAKHLLCGCGSGQKVGKCECGSQKAHDVLGVKYDSFGAILKNFG